MQIHMTPFSKGDFGDTPKMLAAMDRAVNDQCAEGVRYMTKYPPAPAGSTYTRTGKLRQSWSFNVKSGSGRLEGEIGSSSNVAPYNDTVQGLNQAKTFSNIGWNNVDELSQKIEREFANRAQDIVDRYFK